MIYNNEHEISGIYIKNPKIVDSEGKITRLSRIIDVDAVYKGYRLVWSKFNDMLSCYSNGYWIDQYPWADNTYWVD